MPFYYDLTSVNIFCHLVVRMSSPFIIAVIHQCLCVSSFHDSSSFMVVSPTSKFLNIGHCWEDSLAHLPLRVRACDFQIRHPNHSSFVMNFHMFSSAFIIHHHCWYFLSSCIILRHLAWLCIMLIIFYHQVSFICYTITSGTLYIVLSIFHLQSLTNNDATST